jgi:hypothetical protein
MSDQKAKAKLTEIADRYERLAAAYERQQDNEPGKD